LDGTLTESTKTDVLSPNSLILLGRGAGIILSEGTNLRARLGRDIATHCRERIFGPFSTPKSGS
jgi:hypothetical protein